MPELPEVQTIVNDLKRKVLGRRFTAFWSDTPRILPRVKIADLDKQIRGYRIQKIDRRGKNILFLLRKTTDKRGISTRRDEEKILLVHQKLTGHLLVGKWRIKKQGRILEIIPVLDNYFCDPINNYIRAIFYLDNGWMIGLADVRKFAKILFGPVKEIESAPDLSNLGPEPLERHFDISKFHNLIKQEKRKIKQVLMDQEVISGIGNIYSDEILWMAKVHPFKSAKKLSTSEIKAIWQSMHKILNKAIELRGTSTSDFRDTSGKPGGYTDARLVYQREDEPCPRCRTKIRRIKMGGRSAHFCPRCQKIQNLKRR